MSSKVAGAKKLLKDHPCKREHEQSLKCLATQSRDLCTKFFLDYKECMKEWRKRDREAKLAGIQ